MPKMEKIIGEWRKLHNVHLTQYCSGDPTENNEMGGARSKLGGEEMCIDDVGGES